VYERVGGFDHRLRAYGEDWEMWVRIAASYPVWFEVEPLAVYRLLRGGSLSGSTTRTGANAHDLRRAIEIIREYLPADRADALTRESRVNNAMACTRRARRLLVAGDREAALAQLREALRFTRTPRVLAAAAIILALWGANAAGATLSRESGKR
jgi:hypothetical protein